MEVLFEDNHIIAINKQVSDIVQGDKTGDVPLTDKVKLYLKEKYNKPGNVFVGLPHRLDRPTSGIVLLARTSKALARLNEMFQQKQVIKKIYWAIVKNCPVVHEGELSNYLVKDESKNKSFVCKPDKPGAKQAVLKYKLVAKSDTYYLLEVELITGRHHQIRAQLSHLGSPVKGDLKYGFPRSNPDAGISLHARKVVFIHPVTNAEVEIVAPVPDDKLWKYFEEKVI